MANDTSKPSNNKQSIDSLKTSGFDRRMSIAKTSLNIGRRWAGNSVSGMFLNKEARTARNQAFMEAQASYLASELGKLKGSVVKIGQMLAIYGEHILPPEITRALQTLNDDTATLTWPTIEQTLRQLLGEKLNELDVDPVPIGTASLAQVHRATVLATGEQVVLKIQYPGVADAINSDLALFKRLLKVSNIVPQTRALDAWFEEIRDLLHHEVDYEAEAATTERFYDRLSNDPRYIVPKINRNYSKKRLLCMSYEPGITVVSEALQLLPHERRSAIGQAAIEIMMQEIFVWGEMQTDPNFGNYLVRVSESTDDIDKLVLLDFGAIRQFDSNLLTIARGLLRAGYHHNHQAMTLAMTGYDFFDSMSDKVRSDIASLFLLATEPFSDPEKNDDIPTDCLDEQNRYIWANSKLHSRLSTKATRAMQSFEFNLPPKEFMFISRKFIGAYTFLTVLDAHTNPNTLVKPYL
ncbi:MULTISPECIES: ABC1 kinase family protein [Psychrobacter]|uniref:ABC1 kinase family protein n=1 Tax=Psychrobacter TaxID=497 RepID=UPI000EEC3F16|nr:MULTISPECIES: AarF/ABC1/UbiB kinase family protein [Psychrobacter]MBZ1391374.1 AarF/ABC1/UbiB kinase family protein [Psychrobacter pacificensis]HCI30893.1 ABC transporter [Psychrobacter sp.]|tara:strand:+ start:2120 stop:3514 length:1395 start_codon:yes stop_codon:yes gene_type:complete